MKIAIWRTGHEIADTVAESLIKGLDQDTSANAGIGYGILRGMADNFKRCDNWFNVDRGYFKPAHYDGYYRISLKGTQQAFGWPEPDYERLEQLKLDIKPWRGFDHNKPVLIIPPTEHVRQFFNYTGMHFKHSGMQGNCYIRIKDDPLPLRLEDYSHVVTFNSSVGWKALQAGIPCLSHPQHSIVGAWFKNYRLGPELSDAQSLERTKLFAVMSALQMTLQEMREGKLWPLMEKLLQHSSDGIAAKPSAAM